MSADLTKAIRVLDEAYERYERMESEIARTINAFTDAIKDEVGSVTNGAGSIEAFYDKSSFITRISKFLGLTNIAVNITGDISSAKSWKEIGIGIIVDGVTWGISNTLRKGKKAIAVFGMGDVVDKIFDEFGGAFDLRSAIQDFFKDYDIDKDSLQKGILRVTMKDGTVYARPLKGTNSSGNYSLFGGSGIKDDVLFGGSGNDYLNGYIGNDILIGGAGSDTYMVDYGDIIMDSDGKGSVWLYGFKLTGGRYDRELGAYTDGVHSYKEINGDLHINFAKNPSGDDLIIKNFNKDNNDLGITLLDQGEISITISDNEKAEGDNGEQSMNFNIKVNGEIPKGEYAIININGQEYLIGNPSTKNIKKDNLDISKYKRTLTYTHKWQGNKEKEEDKKFTISGNVVKSSQGLKVKGITSGNGTIIDDDKDDKQDPEDIDPIIIDLNKNKITSTKLNNTIYFDHDNNNFKEATSWIDKGDAFLALDKNNNGLIDNGNELFGNHTISNTRFKYTNNKATNGYEALKTYDLNGDNVIDSKDEIYDKLVLWKDSNQNAITDKGELIKLKDSGIVSIDLNYKNINTDEKGNTIKQSSTITFEDGTTTIANDVWFKVNLDKTKHISIDEMIKDTLINLNKRQDELIKEYKENNNLNTNDLNNDESLQNILNSDEILKTYNDKLNTLFSIKSLPQVKAFGNLSSLREAMVNNPKLATMVNLYLLMDEKAKKENISDIVYEWAGVSSVDDSSMRGQVKEKDMIVYEKLSGKPFMWKGRDKNANWYVKPVIEEIFNNFKNYVYANIELQTTYQEVNLDIDTMKFDGKEYKYDFSSIDEYLKTLCNENKKQDIIKFINILKASLTYKPVATNHLNKHIFNIFKNDIAFMSEILGNVRTGTDFNDYLYGSNQTDVINGKGGDDKLYGAGGDDLYEFDKNFGHDIIYDTQGDNEIVFTDGIALKDLSFKRELANLIIYVTNENGKKDSITVQNAFCLMNDLGDGIIQSITFADGTKLSKDDILNLSPLKGSDEADKLYLTNENDILNAGNGNDEIHGKKGDDIINGDSGDDRLFGGDGNDILNGGTGNDELYGEEGNDTYVFSKEWGQDIVKDYDGFNNIEFIDNISVDDLAFDKNGRDLVISDKELKNTITIKDVMNENGTLNNSVEKFIFNRKKDGKKETFNYLTSSQILDYLIKPTNESDKLVGYNEHSYNINALDGNDTIITNIKDDILIGGKGDDTLIGKAGNDIYIFSKDFGNDTIIEENSDKNVIKFADGISKDDLLFKKLNNDLVILQNKNSVTIKDMFNGASINSKIDKIVFDDGSSITNREFINLAVANSSSNENDTLIGYFDDDYVLDALDGNDTIITNGGNDVLIGGAGDDTLKGGKGNDTYKFELNHGKDIIEDNIGKETIVINGKTKEDLIFTYDATTTDLIINYEDNKNDSITIKKWKYMDNLTIKFDDNSYIDDRYITNKIKTINSDSDTSEVGIYYNTNLEDGDDVYVIKKDAGKLSIYDNFTLHSYKVDGGNDTIKFDEISSNEVVYKMSGNNLLIGIAEENKKFEGLNTVVTIKNWTSKHNRIENFAFSDKTLSQNDIIDKFSKSENFLFQTDESDKATFKNGGVIYALDGDDEIVSVENKSEVYGNEGNDKITANGTIYGNEGDDTLKGYNGDDTIYGGEGDDILIGASGDDFLQGDSGDDTYVFAKNWGNDTINNFDKTGKDTVKFIDNISKEDLIFARGVDGVNVTNDLFIYSSDKKHSIKVIGFFNDLKIDNDRKIEFIKFDNEDTLKSDDIKYLVLNGSDYNDVIKGYNEDYVLSSKAGDDIIYGGNKNDTLIGGTGNDTLQGGDGDDKYIFNLGDGKDEIYDINGNDIIEFGKSITKDSLIVIRDGENNLKIYVKDNPNIPNKDINLDEVKDIITLKDVFHYNETYNSNVIETVIFNDGSTLSFDELKKMSMLGLDNNQTNIKGYDDMENIIKASQKDTTIQGGDLKDTIYGGQNNDIINANDGNDTVYGNGGDDIIYGGSGDDILYGNDGDDTINGEFGDDIIYGNDGDDSIDAGLGNDTLIGGSGNDKLQGRDGDDTYIFNLGDGKDIITERELSDPYLIRQDSFDTVKFTKGVNKDDILLSRNSDDLIIKNKTNGDEITVKNHFFLSNRYYKINSIEFDDGTIWDEKYIDHNAVYYGSGANDELSGYMGNDDIIKAGSGNDTIYGFDGDDEIYGEDGDDYLSGGNGIEKNTGNDKLYGGAGNDQLRGEDGNDYLNGGIGDDRYYYSYGDGFDTIENEGGGSDSLIFFDITRDRLSFSKEENDLIINIDNDANQGVRVKNYFLNDEYALDMIQPGDQKPAYTKNDIDNMVNAFDKPILTEDENANIIDTKNDEILQGSDKNNTYYYHGGKDLIVDSGGIDTLKFMINGYRLNFSSNGTDLSLSLGNMQDKNNNNIVTIKDFFANENSIIETIQLKNGYTITSEQIYQSFGKEYPKDDSSNTTDPQPNENNLVGGNEDNKYIFSGGQKTVIDSGGNDTIKFTQDGNGLNFSTNGTDLTLNVYNHENDTITVKNFFTNPSNIIENFELKNGYTITSEQIYQSFGKEYPSNNLETFGLSNATINKIVENLNSYSDDLGANLNYVGNAKNNFDIMQIYSN